MKLGHAVGDGVDLSGIDFRFAVQRGVCRKARIFTAHSSTVPPPSMRGSSGVPVTATTPR